MQKTVDYYLFLLSPWSYLGINRIDELVKKHDLKINYKPIDVMQTFENMGGVPPMKRHPSRQRFRMDELKRWSAYLNVPMNFEPAHFPTNQAFAAKMAIAAGDDAGPFSNACLTAVWAEEKDIADVDTLRAIATSCGLDADALVASAESDDIANRFQAITDEAHGRDVFGSPTFVYEGENFWGQDRIDFLDRALSA